MSKNKVLDGFYDTDNNLIELGSIVIATRKRYQDLIIGVVEKFTPKGVSVRPYTDCFLNHTESFTEFFVRYKGVHTKYDGIKLLNLDVIASLKGDEVADQFEKMIERVTHDST